MTQYFTQLNSYHVILELLPELQNSPLALEQIYINSPNSGEQVPLNVLVKYDREDDLRAPSTTSPSFPQ